MSQQEMVLTSPSSGERNEDSGAGSGSGGSEAGSDVPMTRDPAPAMAMVNGPSETTMAGKPGWRQRLIRGCIQCCEPGCRPCKKCLRATAPCHRPLLGCLGRNLQTVLILTGLILGILFGVILKYTKKKWTDREIMYVGFLGSIFINMLRGVTIPLILASLVAAVGSLDVRLLGRIGGRALFYYMLSTLISVFIGIGLVFAIKPGTYGTQGKLEQEVEPSLTEDIILDMIRQLFPPNIVQAFLQSHQTKLIPPTMPPMNMTNFTTMTTTKPKKTTMKSQSQLSSEYRTWKLTSIYRNDINIMGLIFFSVILGISLAKLGERGKIAVKWADGIAEAMMKVTNWIIWISPVGIFFLMGQGVLELGGFQKEAKALGLYIATCLTGFLIHSLFILPTLYIIFIRKLPFKFIWNVFPALLMALSTASSLATLPVTIRCLEKKNKVDKRVTRFVLPIGANINMDGMALYEAVAVIFIAQLEHGDLTFGRVLSLSIIATVASIGASGVPQAGIVMTLLVLSAVGLPLRYIIYIVVADTILDRFATMVNVFGDCIAAGVVGHWTLKHLQKFDLDTAMTSATTMGMAGRHGGENGDDDDGVANGGNTNQSDNNGDNGQQQESLSVVRVTYNQDEVVNGGNNGPRV